MFTAEQKLILSSLKTSTDFIVSNVTEPDQVILESEEISFQVPKEQVMKGITITLLQGTTVKISKAGKILSVAENTRENIKAIGKRTPDRIRYSD